MLELSGCGLGVIRLKIEDIFGLQVSVIALNQSSVCLHVFLWVCLCFWSGWNTPTKLGEKKLALTLAEQQMA